MRVIKTFIVRDGVNETQQKRDCPIACRYDGSMPDQLYRRRRGGAKPPSCSVSSSLPVRRTRRVNESPPCTRARDVSDRDVVGGLRRNGPRDPKTDRTSLSLRADSRGMTAGSPYRECTLASWASALQLQLPGLPPQLLRSSPQN